jgi:peptidyl-prolyl cis-trans isomerase D
MPLMSKIRERLAVIFGVFAAFFIIYIIFDWGMDITGRKGRGGGGSDVIGEVNGQIVHASQLNELVREAADRQKQQTGKELDDDAYQQLRQQQWDNLVTQILIDQEIEKLGLTVTDPELVNWVRGDNPPESLVRRFTDSTGKFNREMYDMALNDPRLKSEWAKIESGLRREKGQQKLAMILYSSANVSNGDVKQRFLDQNVRLTVNYVLFDPGRYVTDTTITATDDDIMKYYKENQDEYKQNAVRKLKYVQFPETPSKSDSAMVLNELTTLQQQIEKGVDFVEQAKTYSETPPSDAYIKHGEMGQSRGNAVFGAKLGSIVGPILDTDGYHLIKILDARKGKDLSVRASHILWMINSASDTVTIYDDARKVLARARKGEDFASLARTYSQDGSAASGGDLGWNTKGQWVKQFEDAAFRMRPGEISGLVRSQFGLHIIKVTGREDREIKVADIYMSIKPTAQTKDQIFQNAQDFAYLAKQGDFDKEATLSKYQVLETSQFAKGPVVPGIGYHDLAMKFAYNSKLGEVSDPMRVPGGYAVFKVSDIKEEGTKPLDEVKETVRQRVINKKRMEKVGLIAKEAYTKIGPGDDLSALKKNDPMAQVLSVANFSLNGAVPSIGRDFQFVGNAMRLNKNEISKPFEGIRGYFIIQLIDKVSPDSAAFEGQKQALWKQMIQERRQRFINDWLAKLKETANIKDEREKFFR